MQYKIGGVTPPQTKIYKMIFRQDHTLHRSTPYTGQNSAQVWAMTVSISAKVHALKGPNSVEMVSPHESLHPLDQDLVIWFIVVKEGLTHPLDQVHQN